MLLTQPWSELRLATVDDVRRAVATIADAVNDTGRRLVVRPHPRERHRPYDDIETIDHQPSAELQPRVRGASLVIGDTSSALLHLASMFEVPTLRVSGIAPDRLGTGQSALLAQFVGEAVPITHLAAALRRFPEER